jgi:hypothetical protein
MLSVVPRNWHANCSVQHSTNQEGIVKREMEGNNEQRRASARKARAEGKTPSEQQATQGASRQRKEVKQSASHTERSTTRSEGKAQQKGRQDQDQPRPGGRDVDPKRTDRWG